MKLNKCFFPVISTLGLSTEYGINRLHLLMKYALLISLYSLPTIAYAVDDGTYYCRTNAYVSIDGSDARSYEESSFPLIIKSKESKILIPEGWFRDTWTLTSVEANRNTIYLDNMAGQWIFIRQGDDAIYLSLSVMTFSSNQGMNHNIHVANATCNNWD